MSFLRPLVAELIGTFFLCFAGIAAILSTHSPLLSGAGIVGIALAHGLALSCAIVCFGGVSGAHFNPAVTLGMLLTGRIGVVSAAGYIVAQIAGSVLGALICLNTFPLEAVSTAKLGIPLPFNMDGAAFSKDPVLILEGVMTFLLMTSIFGTAIDERGKGVKIGAFGIGLAVTFLILAGGPMTGASMNPARSLGPTLVLELSGAVDAAVMQKIWGLHWLYWVGPVAGAVIAGQVYHHLLLEKPSTP